MSCLMRHRAKLRARRGRVLRRRIRLRQSRRRLNRRGSCRGGRSLRASFNGLIQLGYLLRMSHLHSRRPCLRCPHRFGGLLQPLQ